MAHSDAAARSQLTHLLNEALLKFRGQYAMHGGLNWTVTDVTRAAITVRVIASGKAATDPVASATKLRNCVLAFLRDIVPSERFVARVRTPDRRSKAREIALPYAGYGGSLDNNVVLIEEVCEPKREALRRVVEPIFARLGPG